MPAPRAARTRRGEYYRRRTCRACGSRHVHPFLDLGALPLAGNFLTEAEIGREQSYPLRIFHCRNCSLVQVLDVVSRKTLFSDYRYLSSVTATLREHFERYAAEIARSQARVRDPFVVEIGANDGVLLHPLKERGIRALGIEPAPNVAQVARDRGLEIVEGFFDEYLAQKVVRAHGTASVVTASNVFAHIDDLDGVVRGVRTVLRPGGVFIVEVHYLRELLRKMQYDFFYHEHLCYYSLTSLVPFFERHGFRVVDAQPIPIHAGSIRVFVRSPLVRPTRRLAAMISRERMEGLSRPNTYARFGERVASHARILRETLVRLRSRGKSLAGYGAPGRGNTLLGYSKIDRKLLPYIVDASPSRFGRFTPGTHIPIVPPSEFEARPPDYALMLAWSYSREILAREQPFVGRGGKFIVPMPRMRVIP